MDQKVEKSLPVLRFLLLNALSAASMSHHVADMVLFVLTILMLLTHHDGQVLRDQHLALSVAIIITVLLLMQVEESLVI